MISLKNAIETALGEFVERHTGVLPEWKPSKKAHLASSSFFRRDADAVAAKLNACADECRLFSVPLICRVRSESGWLLFDFTADVIDAYAAALPPAEEPDDTYFARRLWIAYRHADAKTPDDPFLLDGFYAALTGAPNGEERFLSAPKHYDGNARISLEQRTARMAKVLLWERRNTL